MMLASFMGFLKLEILQGWSQRNNLSKMEQKLIQGAINYTAKAAAMILERLDIDTAMQLKRDIKTAKIYCQQKSEANIKTQDFDQEARNMMFQVSRYDLDTLAEHAFRDCEGCNQDYGKCELRQIFIRLSVEPANSEAQNECQYRY